MVERQALQTPATHDNPAAGTGKAEPRDGFDQYRTPDLPPPPSAPAAVVEKPAPSSPGTTSGDKAGVREPDEVTMEPLKVPGWSNDSKDQSEADTKKPESFNLKSDSNEPAQGSSSDTNRGRQDLNNNSRLEKSMESEQQLLTRPDLSPSQEAILDAAKAGLGKDMWTTSPFAGVTEHGKLGAAASVSEILKNSGYSIDSASINGVEQQIKQAGFQEKPISEVKAGDVVVYEHASGTKRIGVAGDPDLQGKSTIYQMNRDGKWIHSGMPNLAKLKVYSPPGTCE